MHPEPPLSPDVDLARLDSFMLDTVRLLGSELVALSTGDEFKAAVLLWCRAWKQRPACSVPTDDRILASFAGLGRDLKGWRKVKDMALRGFVLCSDGRLYHPILAEDGKRAFKAHQQRLAAIRKRYEKATAVGSGEGTNEATSKGTGGDASELPETGRDGTLEVTKNASPATRPFSDKSSPLGFSEERKINGFDSGISVAAKWRDPGNRDAYAVQQCIPFLPGRDDGERWIVALAAEDPASPDHAKAVALMLAASKRAKVGWVSPERRRAA